MRAVFLGSPAAAVPSLSALAGIAEITGVITNPDRRRGRSGSASPTPVKVAANQWGFPVLQPETKDELLDALQGLDSTVAVVVAYGQLLTPAMLATSGAGFVNVHFSMLPRWRGAAPVERALLAGDEETGVSLMQLDEGMDTGPVIAVRRTPIEETDTGGSLTARLSALGARLLADALPQYLEGALMPASQVDVGSTHAAKLTTADGQLDSALGVIAALRTIRALHPRPGAWFEVEGVRMKVYEATYAPFAVKPGNIERQGEQAVMGFNDGALSLDLLQPAGRAVQTGGTWMNGRRGEPAVADAVLDTP